MIWNLNNFQSIQNSKMDCTIDATHAAMQKPSFGIVEVM